MSVKGAPGVGIGETIIGHLLWADDLILFSDTITGLQKQSLHWSHNDDDGVSNHQPQDCLLNRLFRHRSKKTSKLRVTGRCVGNSPGPVNSPHKGPVTRKMFPFDDVIMLDGVMKFCSHNRMIVNESKTQFMQFGKREKRGKTLKCTSTGRKLPKCWSTNT